MIALIIYFYKFLGVGSVSDIVRGKFEAIFYYAEFISEASKPSPTRWTETFYVKSFTKTIACYVLLIFLFAHSAKVCNALSLWDFVILLSLIFSYSTDAPFNASFRLEIWQNFTRRFLINKPRLVASE